MSERRDDDRTRAGSDDRPIVAGAMSRRGMKRALRVGSDAPLVDPIAFPEPPRATSAAAPNAQRASMAPARPTRAAPSASPGPPPRSEIGEASRRHISVDTLVALGIAAACFIIAGVIAARMFFGGASTQAPAPHASQRPPRVVAEPPSTVRAEAPARPPLAAPEQPGARHADPMGLARTLRQCVRDLADDPAGAGRAMEQFTHAVDSLSNAWCDLDKQALAAANESIVEFLHVASRDAALAQRVVERIGAGASRMIDATRLSAYDVWRSAWSVGMLTRLARERDLPAATLEHVARRYRALERLEYGGDGLDPFTRGALGALWAAPDMIAGGAADAGGAGHADAWRRWSQAVDALVVADPRINEALALRAATAILVAMTRAGPDQETRAVLNQLLLRVDWSAAGAGRSAVVAWLDDAERIGVREADIVMRRLVDIASGAGVVQDDIFGERATPEQRARVRDRLAVAWGLAPTIASEGMRERFVREARAQLQRPAVHGEATLVTVRRAAAMARVSEAGARLWRHEIATARAVLADIEGPIDAAASGAGAPGARAERPSGDGAWTLRFVGARRNIAERRRVIGQLVGPTGPLGPIDAATLVNAAMFGSPAEVRAAAIRIVEARANEANVVNAVLEELPRAPRVAAVARMVERVAGARLPEVRDRAWPIAARRALVRRLLDMLGGRDDYAALDRLSVVVGRAYDAWPPPSIDGAAVFDPDPADAAASAWESIRAHAAAVAGLRRSADLAAIERRRAASIQLANGPTQRFVANQSAIVETLAFVVSAERPELAHAAEGVVERHRAAVGAASDVFAQIDSGERAVLTLWLMRFGVEASP